MIRRALASLKDRYLGADPRWLGVFRIGLGVLLCVEVLRRWYYARDFYTNEGFLPNHYSLFAPMGRNVFSIYHAFSTYGEVSVAFALTLVVFILFTLGFRTRLFHVLSAVCITSLNARNIFVENGGTVVTCIITVYSMFLPLGSRFSIDALRKSWREVRERTPDELNDRARPERTTARVHSLAMLLFLLQWSAIYFFNTVHKNGMGWRAGTAIHYFLEQDRIVTPSAVWLRNVAPPSLLAYMTWGTLVLEGSLALLILLPVWQIWARRMVLVGVWGLHGMIAVLANLGPFSYAMSLFPLLLLSDRDWQLVTRWFGKASRARVVVFDGASAACLAACRLLKRLDPFDRLTFVDARAPERLPASARERVSTVALATLDPRSGDLLLNGRGLSEALRVLPLGFVAASIRIPGIAGLVDAVARRWSERRKQFASWIGLADPEVTPPSAATPSALRLETGEAFALVREAAVAVLLVAVVGQISVSNAFIPQALHMRRPEWMIELIEYPRLLQGWSMFAPEPPFEDGHVVVDGRAADGRKLDPFTGKPPDFDPHAPKGWGHEQFICDYHNRIRFPGHESNRQHLKQWLLEQHRIHRRPADRLVAFDVWWVQDKSPPPGSHHGEPLPPQKLLSHGWIEDSGAKAWLPKHGEQPLAKDPVPLLGP
jgi:hypothetical protein